MSYFSTALVAGWLWTSCSPTPQNRSEHPRQFPNARAIQSSSARANDADAPDPDSSPISSVSAHNSIDEGRRVVIRFNRRPVLMGKGTQDTWEKWIAIEPRPADMNWLNYGWTVEARGAFVSEMEYRVIILPGLQVASGEVFGVGCTNSVRFHPLAPRLYMPAVETAQLAGGSREFPIQAVNILHAKVRTRRIDRFEALNVMRLFRSYDKTRSDSHSYLDPFSQVRPEPFPGQILDERPIQFLRSEDVVQQKTLRWDEILGPGKPGFLLLEAEGLPRTNDVAELEGVGAQAVVQVTDLGLFWKQSRDQVLAFVFSHETGRPIAGAQVQLADVEGRVLEMTSTDAQGLARVPTHAIAAWMLVSWRDDVRVTDLTKHRIDLYRYDMPDRRGWESAAFGQPRWFLFTDRLTYRPGEKVHIKAIQRVWDQGQLTMPAPSAVELRLEDPNGDLVARTNLVSNEFGSVAHALSLPVGTRGNYHLEIRSGGASSSAAIDLRVEDVQSRAFTLQFDPPPSWTGDSPAQIGLSARYWMGAPVSRGRIQWTAEARDAGFEPAGFEDFLFTSPSMDGRLNRNPSSYSDHGESDYRSGSSCVLDLALPLNRAAPQPQRISLRAALTDLNQQTISENAVMTRHSSDFYVGMTRLNQVLPAGSPLSIAWIAVGADGQPWPEPVAVTVSCFRLEHQTWRMQGAGVSTRLDSELDLIRVSEFVHHTAPIRAFGRVWIPETQSCEATLRLEASGHYLIEARTTDPRGRPVVTAQSIYMAGPGQPAWDYLDDQRVELVADQPSYCAGDTATVLVKTPVSGPALITVERDTVRRSFVVDLRGNSPTFQVPLTDGDAPNVFLSALLVRGRADSPRAIKMPGYRLGYCQLNVEDVRSRLRVNLLAQSDSYRPGQEVEVLAQITDSAARPVRDAEVTLYAVDEGMLQFQGDPVPDPHAYFHAARPLEVRPHITLPDLFRESPDQWSFFNKGYLIGGGGGRAKVRSQFLPCAFWQSGLRTDTEGRARVRFAAPDSLTQYRLMAVAQTLDHRFGSGQGQIAIHQPIMVEPALPRFAHVQDQLIARALVHNQSSRGGHFELALALDQTAISAESNRAKDRVVKRFPLEAKSVRAVDVPVRLVQAGQARWVWSVRRMPDVEPSITGMTALGLRDDAVAREDHARLESADDQDASVSTLLVAPVHPLLRRVRTFEVTAKETNLLDWIEPESVEGDSTVTLRVATTQLMGVADAARALLHYPYGCVEQTSSSLLPWITLRGTFIQKELGLSSETITTNIAAGVRRLLSMQTGDGGLGYWPGARDPMPWGSAYGAMVLAHANCAGYDVPNPPFRRLLDYLASTLTGSARDSIGGDAPCLALYALALAGRPQHAYHEILFGRRNELSREDRDLLALAVLHSDSHRAMASELLEDAARLPAASGHFGGHERQAAIHLLAWLRHGGSLSKILDLTRQLVRRQHDGHWRTTQGNAWSLLALRDYALRHEHAAESVGVSLTGLGSPQPFELTPDQPCYRTNHTIEAGAAWPQFRLLNPNRRRLFVTVEVASPTRVPAEGLDQGLVLTRQYQKLNDDNRPGALEPLLIGDRVLVTLDIHARQAAGYVVVDDPLPAVLEAIHAAFEPGAAHTPFERMERAQTWLGDFQEFRDDRALFFQNELRPGHYSIQYIARVRAAGVVTAPPAKIEEMYAPERYGLTATARFEVAGGAE